MKPVSAVRSRQPMREPPRTPCLQGRGPSGGSRVVGIIGKEDLDRFKMDVDANRYDARTPRISTRTSPAGQWKLSNLGAPYDVGPFLRALADQLPQRETLSDAEVMAAAKNAADAIGWSHEDMIAYAAHVAGDAKQLPQVMATIRTVYTRAASMVDALLDTKTDWSAWRQPPGPQGSPRGGPQHGHHGAVRGRLQKRRWGRPEGRRPSRRGRLPGDLREAGRPDLKPVDPLDGLPRLPRNKEELKQWLDAWDYTKGDPTSPRPLPPRASPSCPASGCSCAPPSPTSSPPP
jgi:hypothetical protein